MSGSNWAVNTSPTAAQAAITTTVTSSSQPRTHPTVVSNRIQIPRLQSHANVILPKTVSSSKTVKVTKTIHVPKTIQISKTIQVPKVIQVQKILPSSSSSELPKVIQVPKTIQVSKTVTVPKTIMVPKTIQVSETVEEPIMEQDSKTIEEQDIVQVPMMVEISNTDEVSNTVEVSSTEEIFDVVEIPKTLEEPKTVAISKIVPMSNTVEVPRTSLQTSENTFRPIVLPNTNPTAHKARGGRQTEQINKIKQLLEECNQNLNVGQKVTPEIVETVTTTAPLQIVVPDDLFKKPAKVYPAANRNTYKPKNILPKPVSASELQTSGTTGSRKKTRKAADNARERERKKNIERQKEIDRLRAKEIELERARENERKQREKEKREKEKREKELKEEREREIARRNQKAVTERLEKEIQQRMMKEIREHLNRDQHVPPHSDLIERRSYVSHTPGALHITRETKEIKETKETKETKTTKTSVPKTVPERGRKRKADQDKERERKQQEEAERERRQQEEAERERERIRCQMIGKPHFEPVFRGYCCVHNTCQHSGNAASINAVLKQCNATAKSLDDAITLLSLSGSDSYYYQECKKVCTCTFSKEEPGSATATSVNPEVTIKPVRKRGGGGGGGAGNADYRKVMGSKSTQFSHMTNDYQVGSKETNRVTITPTTAPVSQPPQAVRFKEINPLFSNINEENAKYCNALIIDPSKPKNTVDRPRVTLQPISGGNALEAELKIAQAATIQVPLNCRSGYYANNQSNVARISNVPKYTPSGRTAILGRRDLESAVICTKSGVTITKTTQGYSGLQGSQVSQGYAVAQGYYTSSEGYVAGQGYVATQGYAVAQGYPQQQGFSQSQGYKGAPGYTIEQRHTSSRGLQTQNSSQPQGITNQEYPLLLEIKEEPWSGDYEPQSTQDSRFQCSASYAESSPRKKPRKQQLPVSVGNPELEEGGVFEDDVCFNPNLKIKEEPGLHPVEKRYRRFPKGPEVEIRYEYSDGTVEIKQEPLDEETGYQLTPSITMIPIPKSHVDPYAYKYLPDPQPNILTIEPAPAIHPAHIMQPAPVIQPVPVFRPAPIVQPVIEPQPPKKKRPRMSIMGGYKIPTQTNMEKLCEVNEMVESCDLHKFVINKLLKDVAEPVVKEEKPESPESKSEEALDIITNLMISNATTGLLSPFKCETLLKNIQKTRIDNDEDMEYFQTALDLVDKMKLVSQSEARECVMTNLRAIISRIEEQKEISKTVTKMVNDTLKYEGYMKSLMENYLQPSQPHRTPAQSTRSAHSARLNAQKKSRF